MIRPLHDNVILELEKAEEQTASGIILTDSSKEKPTIGVVLAVGPGKATKHGLRPVSVAVGDRVVFEKYGNSDITIDGKEYLVVAESKILGVLE